jgi:hypothetical protein
MAVGFLFFECKLYKQDRAVEHDDIAQVGLFQWNMSSYFFLFFPCFPLVSGP